LLPARGLKLSSSALGFVLNLLHPLQGKVELIFSSHVGRWLACGERDPRNHESDGANEKNDSENNKKTIRHYASIPRP
jgi:hypothetical protein